jgi:hypothetical protein
MRKVTSPGQLSKKNPTDEQFPCKQERDLLKTNFVYSKMSLEWLALSPTNVEKEAIFLLQLVKGEQFGIGLSWNV